MDAADRDWWVYDTVPEDRSILVEDALTGDHGSIFYPTDDEWMRAFGAPHQPSKWYDAERVRVEQKPPRAM